ncbi:MAG: lysophospholipid acyltransferase family protein, partial [Pseudomonadota bacterium]
ILKTSGYISPVSSLFADDMMQQIKNLQAHLAAGGNLFVFPEGTRSRTGSIGPFEKGAFSIAKLCKAPVRVVKITHTDRLYPPDSFLFNTCVPNIIEVKLMGSIEPDYENSTVSLQAIMQEARSLLEKKSKQQAALP